MAVTYIKRYRMEVRLERVPAEAWQSVPEGFVLLPWDTSLLNQHGDVKWESFRDELDVHVFPCLGQRDGCRRLMREISGRPDFVPQATWLACRHTDFDTAPQACGTIQGLQSGSKEGAIQNLGVHPQFRDLRVGRALLTAALRGFENVGCRFARLEVTAQNTAAIRLYERFGFQRVKTLFKVAEVQFV